MALGDREKSPGSYGPQFPGARRDRDTGSRELSLEATLASFETTLDQHTHLIERMVNKVDDMDKTLVEVKTQIDHLVTKESCAEGRKQLAEDLKARMDGDREITGVGITVPALWQKYVEATRGSTSSAAAQHQETSPRSRVAASIPPPPKTAMYYVKAISSIVSLVLAIFAITFFAYKMVDRMDRQQAVMQDIQQNLKQLETTEQAVNRRADESQISQSMPPANPGD